MNEFAYKTKGVTENLNEKPKCKLKLKSNWTKNINKAKIIYLQKNPFAER